MTRIAANRRAISMLLIRWFVSIFSSFHARKDFQYRTFNERSFIVVHHEEIYQYPINQGISCGEGKEDQPIADMQRVQNEPPHRPHDQHDWAHMQDVLPEQWDINADFLIVIPVNN